MSISLQSKQDPRPQAAAYLQIKIQAPKEYRYYYIIVQIPMGCSLSGNEIIAFWDFLC